MRAIKILLLLVVAGCAAGVFVFGIFLLAAVILQKAALTAGAIGVMALASGGSLVKFCAQGVQGVLAAGKP